MSTIEVKPGQVWADNDWRSAGRTLEVEEVWQAKYSKHRYATCKVLTARDGANASSVGKRVRIRLDRFKPTSTGYRLVTEPSR